jgi:hypothetical protein
MKRTMKMHVKKGTRTQMQMQMWMQIFTQTQTRTEMNGKRPPIRYQVSSVGLEDARHDHQSRGCYEELKKKLK